ncbi:FitA-like ribbon-helix-helix domain-containing protein [Nakamurella aerolata]|uniref:Antitoxin FitA-like ribbon-helix-helix domain-containing protein n=1 Tax=Nakamurella aerolata TaxID=1656892 RepID=A0A849A8X7_9ACTN|nr:hypothetical protein [Nakamurella aerolata]NNG37009.1 hypothetical protein [Nakamurella aerolata]
MATIQIKNVPEETHRRLRARAAAAHQSLQEYLRGRLIDEAAQPSMDEVLDRIESGPGTRLSFADAVAAVSAERAGR